MVLKDVTNIGPIPVIKRLRQQAHELSQQIRLEQSLLWQSCLEVNERRLLLQIRHLQYIQQRRHTDFITKQQHLMHTHLTKKAELISTRRAQLHRQQDMYRKRLEQVRKQFQRRSLQSAIENRQSTHLLTRKVAESNRRSLELLQGQLQDSHAVVLHTLRSLQSQVAEAVLQNSHLEESITILQDERRCLREKNDESLQRFRTAARPFTDRDLHLKSIASVKNIIMQSLQRSHDAGQRAQTRLHRSRSQVVLLQKQVGVFRSGLARAISERDDLYNHFMGVIEMVRERNARLEDASNERIRDLSQSLLTVKSESVC